MSCAEIPAPDPVATAAARRRQAELTKPPGSLGRLEALSIQLAGLAASLDVQTRPRSIVVLAADHGIAARGVSAYPQAVTAQMVATYLAGGAAINVLAREAGASLVVADLGVAGAIDALPAEPGASFISAAIRAGTSDFSSGPAMTRAEALAAMEAGRGLARTTATAGHRLLAVGEMGIGNTSAASAIVAALTGASVRSVTGHGTGLDPGAHRRKVRTIEAALSRHELDAADPVGVLAAVGGFEIAGLVGLILGGPTARLPIVLDGFITAAAALVAVRLCPNVLPWLIASHRSTEPGHGMVLRELGLSPLLDLDLRLGEGTGAALALPLLDAAAAILREMATFQGAGVSRT